MDREGKVADSTLLQRDPSSAAAPELPRNRRAGGSVNKGPQTVGPCTFQAGGGGGSDIIQCIFFFLIETSPYIITV